MARPLRVEYEGATYHVTARGNERKKIFNSGRDYDKFIGAAEGTFYSHPVKQKNSSLKIEYLSLSAGFRRTSPAVVGDGESLTKRRTSSLIVTDIRHPPSASETELSIIPYPSFKIQ